MRKNQTKKISVSVYVSITHSGLKSEDFSSFIKVLREYWNSKSQLIMSGTEEAMADDERLILMRTDIKQCYNELLKEGKTPKAIAIREMYLKKTQHLFL
ncbi:hypothetical protein [Xanthocytophaga agilis]|uniref:Arm DNA-binding domain-containing protein n=1 Tax=Xanthocytophaga agilis TaxID=3048010 RepID=A0AAE3UGM3_9BACT|nr:hypothetical protein [Xanthocytophaga agilis]MDJ1503446.1 hypothetical protein [Xanthocytophaga agilis]